MLSPYQSEGHQKFRESVREFLDTEVAPFADDWERDRRIPRSAWQAFGRRELLGLLHPADLGGAERDLTYSVVFLEELGRTGYGGLRAAVSVHAYMATHYLAMAGDAGLRRDYLLPAITGDKIAALAITEPDAGSDLAGLSTVAESDGDELIVSGQKSMVTSGTTADFFVVAVRTAAAVTSKRGTTGLSLLVVDADSAGLRSCPQETMGWRSADTAMVSLDAVRVPAGRLVGRAGSGFYYLMRGFQLERLVAATLALGGMRRCLDDTCRYLTERLAFQKRLADFQAVRHRIADLATELAAARQLVYHAVWCYETTGLAALECSMAKLHTTELACRIAAECLQLHGAHGYLDSAAISRHYRDARAAAIAAGPSEVMRDLIAQLVIDEAP